METISPVPLFSAPMALPATDVCTLMYTKTTATRATTVLCVENTSKSLSFNALNVLSSGKDFSCDLEHAGPNHFKITIKHVINDQVRQPSRPLLSSQHVFFPP